MSGCGLLTGLTASSRGHMQDRGLRMPLADDLHIDRYAFFACAKPHRHAWQSGDVRGTVTSCR
jgi:hypothetical protein